jgi:macrodomain Ter protein organizer (MatP/YcbG family)
MATSQISTIRSTATARIQSIDWATHQHRTKAIALAVAVGCYLTFLALRGAYRLGITARQLWEKYELSAKIAGATAALKTELSNITPISIRVDEVRTFAAVAQSRLANFADSAKSEALAITGK